MKSAFCSSWCLMTTALVPMLSSGTDAYITFPAAGSWSGTYKYTPAVSSNQRQHNFMTGAGIIVDIQ